MCMRLAAQDQGLLLTMEAHCLRAPEYGTALPAGDRAKVLLRKIRRALEAPVRLNPMLVGVVCVVVL